MSKSIMQDDKDRCYICGGRATEEHHVFHGSNRKKSEKWGLKVYLCPWCHRIKATAIHGKDGHEMDVALKKAAQISFEMIHGHDMFMQEFGKNYL